jgi:hypothetical protein
MDNPNDLPDRQKLLKQDIWWWEHFFGPYIFYLKRGQTAYCDMLYKEYCELVYEEKHGNA